MKKNLIKISIAVALISSIVLVVSLTNKKKVVYLKQPCALGQKCDVVK